MNFNRLNCVNLTKNASAALGRHTAQRNRRFYSFHLFLQNSQDNPGFLIEQSSMKTPFYCLFFEVCSLFCTLEKNLNNQQTNLKNNTDKYSMKNMFYQKHLDLKNYSNKYLQNMYISRITSIRSIISIMYPNCSLIFFSASRSKY